MDAFPADIDDQTYTIHLSPSTPLAKIELSVTQASAEWEVTATYDPALCEIHCVSRRKRDWFGRTPLASLLLPPFAAIRIYTDFVSKPAIVIVNPAGLGLPCATRDIPFTQEAIYFPSRKLSAIVLARMDAASVSHWSQAHFLSSANQSEVTLPASLPLRI